MHQVDPRRRTTPDCSGGPPVELQLRRQSVVEGRGECRDIAGICQGIDRHSPGLPTYEHTLAALATVAVRVVSAAGFVRATMILPARMGVVARARANRRPGAGRLGAAGMLVVPAAPDQHVGQQGNRRQVRDKPVHYQSRGWNDASPLAYGLYESGQRRK